MIGDPLNDPSWFLDDIDRNLRTLRFARTSRDSLSRTAFLDQRWKGRGERAEIPLSALSALPAIAPRFIWHTAFCCSTLLARLIDVPGANISLKEPNALVTLSNAKRVRHPAAQDLTRAVVALLGRPFAAGEQVTIKPSNLCNNLIIDTLEASPNSKVLLLYSSLRSFLVSIIKKRQAGRHFARRLFTAFSMDSGFIAKYPQHQLLQLTDLQAASMAWLMQSIAFRDVLQRFDAQSVLTLDSNNLLVKPTETLAAVDGFFAFGIGADRIAAIVASPTFHRNSKNEAESFDATQRASESGDIEAIFGEDLEIITQWASNTWPQLEALQPLPRALL